MPIASRPIQPKLIKLPALFFDAILFTGLILTWGAIPWLYFRPPRFLLGQPIPFYAMACLFLGIGFFNTLLLKNLKRFAGKNIRAHNLSNRKGRFAVILVLTLIIAVPYFLSPFAPSQCSYKSVVVAIANAQGQNCTQTCTNWSPANCQGWSSCYNKLIECTNGIDQNGRPCQGCCFDCKIVCQNTDDPPTINGNVTCEQSGGNGWCVNNAQLALSASDPQGYAVTITGDLNGSSFKCGSSCTLDLPSGAGTAHYTATASTSGLSDSGSSTWKYDPDDPIPGLNVSGASGSNGWYISPVSVAAAGTDSISGLAGASLSVDGGAEQSSATLNDGTHTVVASAIDNAGNTASSTFTFTVDTTTPLMNSSLSGAPGSNGWYVSEVQVSASASDATSGINSIEVSWDGVWQTYTAPLTLLDGTHTTQFRATDNAGNVTTTSLQTIRIDTNAPAITTTISGSSGTNGWYTSDVQVGAVASDSGSGLDAFEVSMDGGAWQTYSVPLSFTGGQHILQFRASDWAGNVSQITRSVSLDSSAPVIDLPSAWALGKTIPYEVTDNESGLASVRVVIEDENEKYAKVAWEEEVSGGSLEGEIGWDGKFKDGTAAPPGTYLVWVKAKDKAGNQSVKLGKVTVPEQFNWFGLILPTKTPRPTAVPAPALAPQAAIPLTSSKPAVVTSNNSVGGAGNGQSAPDPLQSNLPLVSAAIAAMAAAYAMRKQEEGTAGPSLYRQIAKAYAAAQEEKKRKEAERRLERQEDQIEAAYRRAHVVPASSNLRSYDDIEDLRAGRKDTSQATSQPGAKKVLAMPTSDQRPDDNPPFWKKVWDGIVTAAQTARKVFTNIAKSIWNGDKGPTAQPTQDISPFVAQVVPTIFAQYTQTAQARPTITPTLQPTPASTPTPEKIPMVVLAEGLKLRSQPTTTSAEFVILPKDAIVYLENNSTLSINDGYCWRQVTYTDPKINAGAIATSPNFLNPLSDFYRITSQGDPITYNNAVPGWNGKHIGNDFAPMPGTNPNPPVFASAQGIVIRAGTEMLDGKIAGYGHYVIVEYPANSLPTPIHNLPEYKPNNSLYGMYAHLKDDMGTILTPGTVVTPGMQIGTMGDSGNTGGFIHLHLELRLGDPATDSNGLKSLNADNGEWYNPVSLPPLDPALVFTPKDTWNGWVAQSQWNSQSQCAVGDPFLGQP